jgi:VWFA-related protein
MPSRPFRTVSRLLRLAAGSASLVLLWSALPSERTARAETKPAAASFPAAVEIITVDAVVLDAHDHPVSGLTRDDFEVFEDGRGQDIVRFEAFTDEETPSGPAPSVVSSNETKRRGGRAFVLLVDDLRIAQILSPATQKAVATFLDRAVRDGDEVTLGTTSGGAWWSARIPEGRADLLAVLQRIQGRHVEAKSLDRMTEYEAFYINTYEDTQGMARLLPDAPASAPSGGVTDNPDPAGSSVKERVKARWKDLNLCTGTSCDGMVRGRAADLDAERKTRTRLSLQAVRRGLQAVSPVHGRKSLLFFSEGFIDDPDSDQRAVTAAAREANTAIYFVDVRGLIALSSVSSAENPEQTTSARDRMTSAFQDVLYESGGAESLADDTGGFSIRNTNSLAAGAERIAAESRVFYLLGLNPHPGKSPRDWRKLRVDVKKPGLKVRARRGYSLAASADAAKEAKKDAKKDAKSPKLDPAVVRALDSADDATGIALRVVSYVFEPLPKNLTRVVVTAEFDTTGAAAEGKGGGLGPKVDCSIVATHRDTGTEYRFDQVLGLDGTPAGAPTWRALAREMDLPPGVTQVRVVVRDPASGAVGSVSQRVEVPAPTGLRLSTPILTDHVEPATGGAKSRPRPALSAHRIFPPGGGLYVQFEVFGAARAADAPPQVTAGLTLRAADGRIVRNAPPSPITADADGRLVRLVGMGLDGLSEGAYSLSLEVRDAISGERIVRDEPFTLSAKDVASR